MNPYMNWQIRETKYRIALDFLSLFFWDRAKKGLKIFHSSDFIYFGFEKYLK